MVTRTPDPGSRTMTLRPGYLRLSIMVPVVIVVAPSLAIGVARLWAGKPAQASEALVPMAALYLVIRFAARSIRLELTESVVRAWQGKWRGHPDLEVPRNEVRAIHYFPRVISFRGPDDEPFMRIDSNYTLSQMRTVAELLRVPLYDHKRWLGLREAGMGRLVYKPTASDRIS